INRLQNSRTLSKIVFNNSWRIVTPSRILKKDLKDFGCQSIYLPNFIELNKHIYKQRNEIKPRILWVRAFHNIYNPKMAINAVKIVKKSYPDVRLCMVGAEKDNCSIVKNVLVEC
ncbi:hypothetical protein OAI82_03090, partial [bacterium]|nr:hypothetical protein [bacterium]